MKNRILQALPAKEYRTLAPHLRRVELRKGMVLYEPGHGVRQCYFPENALVSFLSGTAEGETIEVCVTGNEGVVGITFLFAETAPLRGERSERKPDRAQPVTAVIQIAGSALSVPAEIIKQEFSRCDTVHNLLLCYTHAVLIQIAQTAVCNKFHLIEQRLCRWLLMAQDRIGDATLAVTQDTLARILGSRRASVTVVAGGLQKRGLITYYRGKVTIKDRKRLQTVACECYETIHAAYSKFST
ncbi:MAG: Crp/Fnr family transcriptional regulator [Acidobacteria bacterium]|nr:Crp/Fnr family transcriptional regulator [Acidobacteriota bacterium]